MGIFSLFKKGDTTTNKAPVVPSEEQQLKDAKAYVDAFLDELYTDFDKEGKGDYSRARYRIAGITNYCTGKDVGMISGLAFPQNNPYDKDAIALGKVKNSSIAGIYGYIPKDYKKDYYEFAGETKQLPFLGYIRHFETEGGRSGIMGWIKVYKGNCVGVYKEMIKDARLIQGVFKGYYEEQTLEEQKLDMELILDRHF